MRTFNTVLVVLILSATTLTHAQTTRWVPADHESIQAAIDSSVDGDEVRVSPGIYFENINFLGKAIAVIGDAGPALTIVDGSTLTAGPDSGSVFRFVTGEDTSSQLDGFTLRNGTGTFMEGGVGPFGGGVACFAAVPLIRNCRFVGNTAHSGGGVGSIGSGLAIVEDCVFVNNQTLSNGSGIFVTGALTIGVDSDLECRRCLFDGNSGSPGGCALTVFGNYVIDECDFFENDGAIQLEGGAGTISDCEFVANFNQGYASCIISGGSTPVISDCYFQSNTSALGPIVVVGFDDLVMSHCVLVDNVSEFDHGLISTAAPYSGSITLRHCSVHHTGTVFTVGSQWEVDVTGSIIDGFQTWAAGGVISGASYSVEYSAIDGGYPGVGNISDDPLFADVAGFDLTLLPTSPCINAADPSDPVDPDGSIADMGAFFTPEAKDFLRGDVNDDGSLDISDAIAALSHLFSAAPVMCFDALDANDDGAKNIADPVTLLESLFISGAPLPMPTLDCGPDPTADALSCQDTSCP